MPGSEVWTLPKAMETTKGLKQENDILRFTFLKDCSDCFIENGLEGAG